MPRTSSTGSTFGEALKRARVAKAWSQSELARRLAANLGEKVAPGTVNRWEDSGFGPPRYRVDALADILGISVETLLVDPQENRTPSAPDKVKTLRSLVGARMADEQISIPKLLKVAAGAAVYTPPDDARSVSIGRKGVEALVGHVPAKDPQAVVFAADVKGDSMAPGLLDGDTLIVKRFYPPPRGRGPIIEDGRVYILTPDGDGHAQVKRLLLVEGHQLLVVSDNQRFPPKAVDLRNAERVQHMIIGRVVKLIRDL